MGTIPGSGPGTVVVGAHYDTKGGIPRFVGADDGASGVAVLLELARTLPRPLPGPSVQLVAFDAEEARDDRDFDKDGTRGSRQYVADARAGGRQGAAPLDQIRAMVLFDMIGDCDLQDPARAELRPGALPPVRGRGHRANGRSGALRRQDLSGRRRPHALPRGPDPGARPDRLRLRAGPAPGAYWHTAQDTVDKTCPASLEAVGEAALVAIPQIR